MKETIILLYFLQADYGRRLLRFFTRKKNKQIRLELMTERERVMWRTETENQRIVVLTDDEGLYAEAVNNGLIEILQREYHVNVAGPSTMAAMLNSLQMCFRSMAIQKHSKNVWRVLGDVKNEFDKFADALEKTQQRLETANDELNKLVGVRTRQMQRQLKQISDYESEFLEENN